VEVDVGVGVMQQGLDLNGSTYEDALLAMLENLRCVCVCVGVGVGVRVCVSVCVCD